MKKSVVAMLVALALSPMSVQAGMFGSLPSVGDSSSSSGGDLVAMNDKLVLDYIAADQEILAGQAKMAGALGLKTEAAALQAKADGINANNVTDTDKAISSDAAKAIQDAQTKSPALDKSSKEEYVNGVKSLLSGVKKYIAMKEGVQSFGSSLSTASPMLLPKLATGAAIVKSLPSNAKNMIDAVKSAVKFPHNQGISTPKEASSIVSF